MTGTLVERAAEAAIQRIDPTCRVEALSIPEARTVRRNGDAMLR